METVKKIQVSISSNISQHYPIVIGNDILSKFQEFFMLDNYSKILVVTDSHVSKFYAKKLLSSFEQAPDVLVLEFGEQNKNIHSVSIIWEKMHKIDCDRKSLLVNLGGGVITDLGGFAASTYMRGIDFINIPTSLTAIDASIGGKNGFGFSGIKNLIGTFTQPKGILIDTKTLLTLPDNEFQSGFVEHIKHGIIADKSFFTRITEKTPVEFTAEELTSLLYDSCKIKVGIIENDATEQGNRKILNFGHTVGHALESLSLSTNKPLTHGQAVGIGMYIESKISQQKGLLQNSEVEVIKKALIKVGLPIIIAGFRLEDIYTKMLSDKKNVRGVVYCVLLHGVGNAEFDYSINEKDLEIALKGVLV